MKQEDKGKNMNVFVIDVGTSSMRGILFGIAGEVLKSCHVKYSPEYKDGGCVEQDPKIFLDALYVISKEIACNDIDAISVTSQRSSIIPVDKNIDPLYPFVMWQDVRNRGICEQLDSNKTIIQQKSGAKANTVFSGAKMSWLRRAFPDLYAKTYKFLTIPEYLLYIMTGKLCIDFTYASRSNLMNLEQKKWDGELLEIFEVEEDKLNELIPPGKVVGYAAESYSKLTGIKSGIPVISAGGDQQCAALGAGVCQDGDISIITGSGAFLAGITDKVCDAMSENLIYTCSLLDNKYMIEANVLNCCTAFDWFCKNIYGVESYDKINDALEKNYHKTTDCLSLPFYQGRTGSCWNSRAKGVFCNLDLSMSREDLLKATVEGILWEIRNNLELLKSYLNVCNIYVSGGLTKSRVMNQMQADIYGQDINVSSQAEATARGALCMAWKELGVYSSLEESVEIIQNGQSNFVYHPDMEKYKLYQMKAELMNDLYNKIYGE